MWWFSNKKRQVAFKDRLPNYSSSFELAPPSSSPSNDLAQTVLTNADMTDVLVSRTRAIQLPHLFNIKTKQEANITNQKASGRCWIFAATNLLRINVMAHYNLTTFEFSQSFIFFYDKLEKCNYFLETMIDLAPTQLDAQSRLIQTLFQEPISDGGQWDSMFFII